MKTNNDSQEEAIDISIQKNSNRDTSKTLSFQQYDSSTVKNRNSSTSVNAISISEILDDKRNRSIQTKNHVRISLRNLHKTSPKNASSHQMKNLGCLSPDLSKNSRMQMRRTINVGIAVSSWTLARIGKRLGVKPNKNSKVKLSKEILNAAPIETKPSKPEKNVIDERNETEDNDETNARLREYTVQELTSEDSLLREEKEEKKYNDSSANIEMEREETVLKVIPLSEDQGLMNEKNRKMNKAESAKGFKRNSIIPKIFKVGQSNSVKPVSNKETQIVNSDLRKLTNNKKTADTEKKRLKRILEKKSKSAHNITGKNKDGKIKRAKENIPATRSFCGLRSKSGSRSKSLSLSRNESKMSSGGSVSKNLESSKKGNVTSRDSQLKSEKLVRVLHPVKSKDKKQLKDESETSDKVFNKVYDATSSAPNDARQELLNVPPSKKPFHKRDTSKKATSASSYNVRKSNIAGVSHTKEPFSKISKPQETEEMQHKRSDGKEIKTVSFQETKRTSIGNDTRSKRVHTETEFPKETEESALNNRILSTYRFKNGQEESSTHKNRLMDSTYSNWNQGNNIKELNQPSTSNRETEHKINTNTSFLEGGRSITTQTEISEQIPSMRPVHYDTWNDPYLNVQNEGQQRQCERIYQSSIPDPYTTRRHVWYNQYPLYNTVHNNNNNNNINNNNNNNGINNNHFVEMGPLGNSESIFQATHNHDIINQQFPLVRRNVQYYPYSNQHIFERFPYFPYSENTNRFNGDIIGNPYFNYNSNSPMADIRNHCYCSARNSRNCDIFYK